MIPESIDRNAVIEAIREIDQSGVPASRKSRKYHVRHSGKDYPPKYLISLAAKFAGGAELPPDAFNGGFSEANTFLEKLGFAIIERGDWNARECYFAVWAYDQLDTDSTLVKNTLYARVSEVTGRTSKAVEYKVQNVSAIDPRPRAEKPIAEAQNAQKLLGDVFRDYWLDRVAARQRFATYVQEATFESESPIDSAEYAGLAEEVLIEEGAEGHSSVKARKRSTRLLKAARAHFSSLETDGKLRCHACGYTKPSSVNREIVQLHHTEMISELDSAGRKIAIKEALKSLVPLCPTCHQVAHSRTPPLGLEEIRSLI